METELAGGVTGRFEEPGVDRSVIPSLGELQCCVLCCSCPPCFAQGQPRAPRRVEPSALFVSSKMQTGLGWCIVLNMGVLGKENG